MNFRRTHLVLTFLALAWSGICFLWPMCAFVIDALYHFDSLTVDGFGYRQVLLLGKTALWAGLATGVALVLAVPGMICMTNGVRRLSMLWIPAVIALPMLCPPMLFVFGWQRWAWLQESIKILPMHQELMCILVWALWTWPISAVIVGSGSGERGRSAYEQAVVDGGRFAATMRVTIPNAGRAIFCAITVTWVLLMGEYSVPHAFGLTVYATELLGLATLSSTSAAILLPTLPSIAVVVSGIAAIWAVWRPVKEPTALENDSTAEAPPGWSAIACLAIAFCSAIAPLMVLWMHSGSAMAVVSSVEVYGPELLQTAFVAVLTGLSVMSGAWIGVYAFSLISTGPHKRWGCWTPMRMLFVAVGNCMLVLGLGPAAIAGESVVRAYVGMPFVYSHWPLLVIGMTARFGWIGLLVALAGWQTLSPQLAEQARADGADEWQMLIRVRLRTAWPTLLAGVGLVAALSAAEIAAATLVQVPSIGLISLIIIEKFHRFEDDMLAALSMWLTMPAVLLAMAYSGLWWSAQRRHDVASAAHSGRR